MSSQKGNASRSRGQKHQNTTAYKNDKYGASVQVKIANSKVHNGLCQRCKEVIDVKCSQKTVKDAYHVICKPCALKLELCAKCGKKEDIVIPVNTKEEEEEDPNQKKTGRTRRKKDLDEFDNDNDFGDLSSDYEDFPSDSGLEKAGGKVPIPDVAHVSFKD
ncbi:unnamed protein product [Coregonus sp. 'balchen']|nr:unnamed protein product [Coregonus sp. 'balchen']